VNDNQLKSAVGGLKRDYPKIGLIAAKLNALGQEHARQRDEMLSKEVRLLSEPCLPIQLAGVSTPDRTRYMHPPLVKACYNAISISQIPPTPMLNAFRTPLLARHKPNHAQSDEREQVEEDDRSVENGRTRDAGSEHGMESFNFDLVCQIRVSAYFSE